MIVSSLAAAIAMLLDAAERQKEADRKRTVTMFGKNVPKSRFYFTR
jgi:hypothetical protein